MLSTLMCTTCPVNIRLLGGYSSMIFIDSEAMARALEDPHQDGCQSDVHVPF